MLLLCHLGDEFTSSGTGHERVPFPKKKEKKKKVSICLL